MIKRVIDPEELSDAIDDIFILFEDENKNEAHNYLPHDKESIKKKFCNKYVLASEAFVWVNYEDDRYDAIIGFVKDGAKFGVDVLTEYIWLSKNPKVGFKLLEKATDFARKINCNYITISTVEKHHLSKRNERFYKKIGFKKDFTTFIKKI
jgi:GNAT superfamily N-acetyltransferase